MIGIPILVLDNNPEFPSFVADGLAAAGFRPTRATTIAGAEDLALRGSVRFGALLLD